MKNSNEKGIIFSMWILPTYNRPAKAQKTLDSVIAANCTTPGLVYLDGSQNPKYDSLRLPKDWTIYKSTINRGVCGSLNDAFKQFPNLKWYGFLSDDSIVRTFEWDQKLLAELDDFSIVHSADGWRTEYRIHGAVIFGGELLRALGWWVPKGLIHSFCDDVWEAIAEKLKIRRYLPEVLVEHMHFWNGKTELDQSYLKAYSSFDKDQETYTLWKKNELENAIQRVLKWAHLKSIFPKGDKATSSKPSA